MLAYFNTFTYKRTGTDLQAPACLGLPLKLGPWPPPPASGLLGFGPTGTRVFCISSGVQGFIPLRFYSIVRAALNLVDGPSHDRRVRARVRADRDHESYDNEGVDHEFRLEDAKDDDTDADDVGDEGGHGDNSTAKHDQSDARRRLRPFVEQGR